MSNQTYKATTLVTGGTTGLGYEAALELAKKLPDHQVIIASRSNKDDAAAGINNTIHQKNAIYLPLDLASQESITKFASTIKKSYPKISHLLLNAGLQFPGPVSTLKYFNQDVEKTFAINHLGHAHLFYLLLPHMTSDAHVVITASGTHDPAQKTGLPDAVYNSGAEMAQPNPKTAHPNGRQRYASSKLVNVLWSYALDRHAKASNKQYVVNSFDPGLMFGTGLAREAGGFVKFLWNRILPSMTWLFKLILSPNVHTTKESGFALARLALGDDQGVRGVGGKYFEGLKDIKSSEASYDEKKQEDLWDWTLEFLAQGDEGQRKRWEKLEG